MITETAEEITHRYLVDMFGNEELVEHWRREGMREWCLTLQLCVSFMDEIGNAVATSDNHGPQPPTPQTK